MKKIQTAFEGVFIYERNIFPDNRGHLEKIFMIDALREFNFSVDDAYIALSEKAHTIRGLHAQSDPYGQYKLVTCTTGRMLDIALDLRTTSKTYGQVFYYELNASLHRSVLIPPGFAHGVYTLEDNTTMLSLCSKAYLPEHEFGISMFDLGLDFVQQSKAIVSEKDRALPSIEWYFELYGSPSIKSILAD